MTTMNGWKYVEVCVGHPQFAYQCAHLHSHRHTRAAPAWAGPDGDRGRQREVKAKGGGDDWPASDAGPIFPESLLLPLVRRRLRERGWS